METLPELSIFCEGKPPGAHVVADGYKKSDVEYFCIFESQYLIWDTMPLM